MAWLLFTAAYWPSDLQAIYQSWIANSSVADQAPDSDPDGDGLINAWEYVYSQMGTPTQANRADADRRNYHCFINSNRQLTLSITLPSNLPSGVHFSYEGSHDLIRWDELSQLNPTDTQLGQTIIRTVSQTSAIGEAGSYAYMRIAIDLDIGRTFYVDAVHGNDARDGRTETNAWSSLARVNTETFQPGDSIRFKRSQTFYGSITPSGSGTAEAPIVMATYGSGTSPLIQANGQHQATLTLEDQSHWTIKDLHISNQGSEPEANRKGIYLRAQNEVCRGITLRDLQIHDINGVIEKKINGQDAGGQGIKWESNANNGARFDALLIEGCQLIRCDRDGIGGGIRPWNSQNHLSTNVVIRNNIIEDVGGDGIVVRGCDGALVERNRIYGARQRWDTTDNELARNAGASIGIWPFSSHNTLIRYNEVWGYRGVFDGQAYDADYNCLGTIIEYNFSADNEGGLCLIVSNGAHEESGASIGNINPILRHNISFNDHNRGVVIGGPVQGVQIEGNIFYNTIESEFPLYIENRSSTYPVSVTIERNMSYTSGLARMYRGSWSNNPYGSWNFVADLSNPAFLIRDNFYNNVEPHMESNPQSLNANETLRSLINRFEADPIAAAGFAEMEAFLRDSRHWDLLENQF